MPEDFDLLEQLIAIGKAMLDLGAALLLKEGDYSPWQFSYPAQSNLSPEMSRLISELEHHVPSAGELNLETSRIDFARLLREQARAIRLYVALEIPNTAANRSVDDDTLVGALGGFHDLCMRLTGDDWQSLEDTSEDDEAASRRMFELTHLILTTANSNSGLKEDVRERILDAAQSLEKNTSCLVEFVNGMRRLSGSEPD